MSLIHRMESDYQFECEAGFLKNCVDWQKLRENVTTAIAALEKTKKEFTVAGKPAGYVGTIYVDTALAALREACEPLRDGENGRRMDHPRSRLAASFLNGDHAEFEAEHANTKPEDRPDWPLPSFDARDWAKAFCKTAAKLGYEHHEGHPIDEEWMVGWFANALMRGFDEANSRRTA